MRMSVSGLALELQLWKSTSSRQDNNNNGRGVAIDCHHQVDSGWQLCPTVPNRSNYIHWIEDLLSSDVIAKTNTGRYKVRDFDIGTGANCIFPLLGASLMGCSFVGSDVTDVALEWAERNVKILSELIEIRKAVNDEESFSKDETAEAQLACSELIEIRKAGNAEETLSRDETFKDQLAGTEIQGSSEASIKEELESLTAKSLDVNSNSKDCKGQLVLVGVVKDDERFDVCVILHFWTTWRMQA